MSEFFFLNPIPVWIARNHRFENKHEKVSHGNKKKLKDGILTCEIQIKIYAISRHAVMKIKCYNHINF